MQRWQGKVALVTGASSGIGEAMVRRLVEEGLQVIGLARRYNKIKEIAESLKNSTGTLHAFKCDISQEEDILRAFQWTETNFGSIHLLINNAGVLGKSSLCDGKTDDWKKVFDTNVLGLSVATREAIKNMRKYNVDGDIIHIGSISGHFIMNLPVHVYYASKHAVTVMTEVIRKELVSLGSKIRVTCISPGLTDTKMFEDSGMLELINKAKQRARILDPTDVADALVYVLSTPRHVHIQDIIIRSVGEIV